MSNFMVVTAAEPPEIAPDGSEVRLLARVDGGGSAEFRLEPGRVSRAVAHRSVEEIWYVLEGAGLLWVDPGCADNPTALSPGLSTTIPVGARFQFRSTGDTALRILGVTIPQWPGDGEARSVEGYWPLE